MSQILSADEVKKHNTRSSAWIVIRNEVFDVSSFLTEHPGGFEPLMEAAGQDATIAFDDVGHSENAKVMMRKYKIGTLAKGEGCCKMKPRIWRPSSKYHRECIACDPTSIAGTASPGDPSAPIIDDDCASFASDERPWRTYSRSSRRSSNRSGYKTPPSPKIEKRVPCIIVPREPSSKLKWALLALGLAIIIGIAYKRYAS